MKIFKDFLLENYNGYRFKAFCSTAYLAEDEKDIVKFFSKVRSKYIILGAGYNTILSKEHYNEPVLILVPNNKILCNDENVEAYAGVSLLELCLACHNHSLAGMEVFYDIPGSIGGAVCMNAGNSQQEISALVNKIEYYDVTKGALKVLCKNHAKFSYRSSIFQTATDLIISRVQFKLTHGNANEIANKMLELKNSRWEKQPRNFPNCGSVFKRPEGKYVGTMLDQLGLKGFSIGGMRVSEKHSGFIINFNNGNANDLLRLIESIQNIVLKEYAISLELELRLV
jgi:UDP-N-acetylmuramate dehydrogenase